MLDRLVKVFKPTKSPLPPSPSPQSYVPVVVKAQRDLPPPRIFSLQTKSERNIALKHKRSFAKSNASSASLGRLDSPAEAAQPWYIPNETTIFPLPAPRHPAYHPQPATPATSSHGHGHGLERRPSLSASAFSHATSDLHTPHSPVATARPPPLALWIPEPGTVSPGCEQKFPTGRRDGMYFDLPDGEEDGEGPESASVLSGDAVGAECNESSGEADEPEKVPALLPLELRSSFWIRNEVDGIQDDEMRRLATLAFL